MSDPEAEFIDWQSLAVDQAYLVDTLESLAAYTDSDPPAVTRVLYTETDLAARRFIRKQVVEEGLSVREDAVGNLFARWEGSDPDRPAVATGSHIDAVPESGRYDGTVGVVGGLEAIRSLRRAGFQPRRSIELIVFTAEEPTRFGISCLGSRALTGAIDAGGLRSLTDDQGVAFEQVRASAGYSGPLEGVQLPEGTYHRFVELHIEQGPVLEAEAKPIGLVDAIAAPATVRIELTGEGGHAGTVLMDDRHDAFLAAAEIALIVEHLVNERGGRDTVGTTGICDVYPGAVNSIPSRVRLEVDLRDIDGDRRDQVLEELKTRVKETAAARGVECELEVLNSDPPVQSADSVKHAVEEVCRQLGYPSRTMISRAYHDSLFMARVVPVGMIFIPCRGGISHRPEEYSSPEQIAAGTEVLAGTLARLSLS